MQQIHGMHEAAANGVSLQLLFLLRLSASISQPFVLVPMNHHQNTKKSLQERLFSCMSTCGNSPA